MTGQSAILTVAEMIAAEQALIAGGTGVDALMQRAGRGAADWIWRVAAGRPVSVLCGPGNNGGDGYVIAQAVRERGGEASVIAPAEPRTDAARKARDAYSGEIAEHAAGGGGGVFVDCLFGSGLARPLDEAMTSLLRGLCASHATRIAVDLPSGVEADSGQPLNPDLPHYDLTLALGAWKFAHWLMPACAMMGSRRLVPIGVAAGQGDARLLERPRLQAPAADTHKYRRGMLGIVGGAMPGAALLAAQAAMRGGAGYVKLLAQSAIPVPADLVCEAGSLETMLEDGRFSALLVGPGLGRDALAAERLRLAMSRDLPCVLDADALMLLEPAMLENRSAPLVATPHEGELARLCQSFAIETDGKLHMARALARAAGMVVIAKGPDTVIASPEGELVIAPPASSWLSIAGTGDVLAGLVASRLARGSQPCAAACEAVWLHGEAARLAGAACTPGDLVACVSAAVEEAL